MRDKNREKEEKQREKEEKEAEKLRQKKLAKKQKEEPKEQPEVEEPEVIKVITIEAEETKEVDDDSTAKSEELSKKEKRRLKEAAKKAAMTHPDSIDPSKLKKIIDDDDYPMKKGKEKGDPALRCDKCKVQYETRNKLMQHLKESGHASYKLR